MSEKKEDVTMGEIKSLVAKMDEIFDGERKARDELVERLLKRLDELERRVHALELSALVGGA